MRSLHLYTILQNELNTRLYLPTHCASPGPKLPGLLTAQPGPYVDWGPPPPGCSVSFVSKHLSHHRIDLLATSPAPAPRHARRRAPSPPPVLFASGHVSGVPPPENVKQLEGTLLLRVRLRLRRPLSWTAWAGRSVRTCGCFHFLVRPITLL